MRTTLDIDDTLHEQARRVAFEQRRSLGDVISEWAAKGLEAEQRAAEQRPLGRYRGAITIADDFDVTPTEVATALDQPVGQHG